MSRYRLIPLAAAIAALSVLPAAAQTNSVAEIEKSYITAHNVFVKATAEPCMDRQTHDKAITANREALKIAFDNWSAKNSDSKDWSYINKMVLSLMSEYDAINRVPLCAKAELKPVVPPPGPAVQPPGEKDVKKPCITQDDINRKNVELALLTIKADGLMGKINEKKQERNDIDGALARLNTYFDDKGKLKPLYVNNPDLLPEEYQDIDAAAERIDKTNAKNAAELEITRLTNEWVPIATDIERLKEEIEHMEKQLKAQDCGPKTASPVDPPATKNGRSRDKGKKMTLHKDENRVTTSEVKRVTTSTPRQPDASEEQKRRTATDAVLTGISIGTSIGFGLGGHHGLREPSPAEHSGSGGFGGNGGLGLR